MMKFLLISLIFIFSLTACSQNDEYNRITHTFNTYEGVAMFARVGIEVNEKHLTKNAMVFHESFSTINVDDLGVYIQPCQDNKLIFCLSGGQPFFYLRR